MLELNYFLLTLHLNHFLYLFPQRSVLLLFSHQVLQIWMLLRTLYDLNLVDTSFVFQVLSIILPARLRSYGSIVVIKNLNILFNGFLRSPERAVFSLDGFSSRLLDVRKLRVIVLSLCVHGRHSNLIPPHVWWLQRPRIYVFHLAVCVRIQHLLQVVVNYVLNIRHFPRSTCCWRLVVLLTYLVSENLCLWRPIIVVKRGTMRNSHHVCLRHSMNLLVGTYLAVIEMLHF